MPRRSRILWPSCGRCRRAGGTAGGDIELEKRIHRAFQIGVFLKGGHAALELVGGVGLAFVSAGTITNLIVSLVQEELKEDPHDIIANYLFTFAQQFSVKTQTFAALYLLSHGVIKLILVAELLREKLWAYPASLVVLGVFIAYQAYRFTLTHSIGLIALSMFDLLVIILIWHEYRLVRRHLARE